MIRLLVLLLFAGPAWADPPGLVVAESEPQSTLPSGAVKCAEGRFVPLTLAPGQPSLLLGNKLGYLTLYPLAPGEAVHGIRYDEPAGAKVKRYTFPASAKANYYAVANALPEKVAAADVELLAVVNGKTPADAPTVAGSLVISLTASIPPPVPEPTPVPVPVPVVGKMGAFIVIEPSGTIMPNRAELIRAADEWQTANNVGRRWVYDNVVDQTNKPPADMKPWLDRAKGKSLPYLYCITTDGGILFEGPLDTSGSAALKSQLDKYKGK